MRTTLDIADDVLIAANEIARRDKRSAGDVISDLARRTLLQQHLAAPQSVATARGKLASLGIEALPKRCGTVSNELINELRDDGQ